ncbi:hypothetical protein PGT21_012579 [Puccinia graminis f. sp. tritici]|uniref:Uncharacterized protein n=1 Tax=Puccinia graminis f. sp. tritici TaxID=56615 RepID=A0A5B0NDT0_PUCGR|nr:hypothetical protein PGT21_012579 [Puccinia graminis f. sp. tritici]
MVVMTDPNAESTVSSDSTPADNCDAREDTITIIRELTRVWKRHREPIDEKIASTKEALSIDESKALLFQLHTSILPILRQQIKELFSSDPDDQSDFAKKPHLYKHLDILGMTAKIDHTLDQIRRSVEHIACETRQSPSNNDREWGALKRYRTVALLERINSLLTSTSSFFPHYILLTWPNTDNRSLDRGHDFDDQSDSYDPREILVRKTDTYLDCIDRIIDSYHQSDLVYLRKGWQWCAEEFESYLAKIIGPINSAISEAKGHLSKPASTLQDDQPEAETDRSEVDSTDGSEDDRSSNSDVNNESESSRTYFVPIAQSVIPIIKLNRLLFKKLSGSTSSIQRLLAIDDTMLSSQEIESLKKQSELLPIYVNSLLDAILHIYNRSETGGGLNYLQSLADLISNNFHSTIKSITRHLASSTLQRLADHPPSKDLIILKTWLLTIANRFAVASCNFRKVVTESIIDRQLALVDIQAHMLHL